MFDLPHLTGGGLLTEYVFRARFETLHGFYTTLVPSTAAQGETTDGKCCQILVDTLLQIHYRDAIAVGSYRLDSIGIELPDEPYAFGRSDVLLIVRASARETEYYVPTEPPTLEILSYAAPTRERTGEIRGRIAFEARGYRQRRSAHGSTVTVTPLEGTIEVRARFVSPMRFQFRESSFDGS